MIFRVLNGAKIEAVSFNLGNALDHADRIAAHGGRARVVRVESSNVEELSSTLFDARAHKCGSLCKKLARR